MGQSVVVTLSSAVGAGVLLGVLAILCADFVATWRRKARLTRRHK